jgi:N-acetylneuraminic acid mutarotase
VTDASSSDVSVGDSSAPIDAGPAISPALGSGTWTDLAPVPGGPRYDGSGAVVNGWLFVVGGQLIIGGRIIVGGQGDILGRDVEAYNPKTNTWQTHSMFPVALSHANVAGVGDKLYVLGGRGTAASYVYDPFAPVADRMWRPIAPIPGQRESAAVGVIGGKIYLAGGAVTNSDPPRGDLFVYDPATDTWDVTQPPMPIGRTHFASAVVNDVLYVTAGRVYFERHAEAAGWLNSTYAYDPKLRQWSQKKNAPTARSGCVGASIKGLFIVAGGLGGAPGGPALFPQVEAYNPDTDEWTTLAPMKHPRDGQAQVGIDDKLYTAGGTGTDITDMFTLP